MRNHRRLAVAVVGTFVGLALSASLTQANKLEFNPHGEGRGINFTFRELTFSTSPAGIEITCAVTMSLTVPATIAKRIGTTVGAFTSAETEANCRADFTNLAYTNSYLGFEGELPRIRRQRFTWSEARFILTNALLRCTYAATSTEPLFPTLVQSETTHVVTRLEFLSTALIRLAGVEPGCPAKAGLAGSGEAATGFTIRLIA